MPLSASMHELLKKRFRHYTEQTDLAFLQEEQPGVRMVAGAAYPALLLLNDVFWFPSRSARPLTDSGGSMKTVAPKGVRFVMVDDPTLEELTLVEGEGDAFALRCVGYAGIAIAGGVNNLLDRDPRAVENRRATFAGKRVRILFDPDDAGKKGAIKVARQLLHDGAARVAIIDMPTQDDVEDWLETMEQPSDALRAVTHLIGGSAWSNDEELEQQEAADEKDIPLRTTTSSRVRVPGDKQFRLLAMTYERESERVMLAKYGPTVEPVVPGYGDISPDVTRGWNVAARWEINGIEYAPNVNDSVRDYLRFGTLVLPPPPVDDNEAMPSTELWLAVRAFIERWVIVPELTSDVMTAYALMTWRLEDAGFRHVPYLRFFGPPGSGKGRALDVMRQICWQAFSTQPTSQNLHRLVDHMGDVTLVIDEFHINLQRENQQTLIDTLCYGYDRCQPVARVTSQGKGKPETITNYRLFGPKVFAGYGSDEHEALARRSVTVEMRGDVKVPREMSALGLPEAFYNQGERLRAHLLHWRGRNLAKGLPDPLDHPGVDRLIANAGQEVAQVFFPLLAMVPTGMSDVVDTILSYAIMRREAVRETRAITDDALLVEAFVNTAVGANGRKLEDDTYCAQVSDVWLTLGDGKLTEGVIGRRLHALGFHTIRPRWDGARKRWTVFDPSKRETQITLKRAGVTWDPELKTARVPDKEAPC